MPDTSPKKQIQQSNKNANLPATIIFGLLVVCAVLVYIIINLNTERKNLEAVLSFTQSQFASSTNYYTELEADLNDKLISARAEAQNLRSQLDGEQSKVNNLQSQFNKLIGTVGTLEKLSQTDKELLQKYSKVYFLNEHYYPPRLSQIDTKYILRPEKDEWIHTDVSSFLKALLDDTQRSNMDIKILSAYRSFDSQNRLKSNYSVTFGSGTANQFSADQGYSEHQLGTTIDFTTSINGQELESFENSKAFDWLVQNAHRFGFILSYPKNNEYYVYEPWHWRFVGKKLADKLHTEKMNFYDVEQRQLDTYLVSIFDT